MNKHKIVLGLCCSLAIALAGCSRQQSDWQKTRETNTAEAYEQFLKKYPTGEFTSQAQARVKELYEERDWQKARDADTADAYQAFLKQYPDGKWAEEARIRVENFSLAQAPGSVGPAVAGGGAMAGGAVAGGAAVAGAVDAAQRNPLPAASADGSPPTAVNSAPAAESSPAATRSSPVASARHVKEAAKVAGNKHSGPYRVQLGAFKSGTKAAKQRWARLQHEYPHLLAGLSSKVLAKKTADGSLYRLQAVGLSEKHAREVCTALRAKSQPCIVVAPATERVAG